MALQIPSLVPPFCSVSDNFNMTSSKNSSAASGKRPRCDQCFQTLVDMSKLRRHKKEQHAQKKTCPLADCKYKGTKRMSLLMGQGSKPGHLEKKHGFSREAAARIVREHEEQSPDTSANSPDQGVPQYSPSNTSVQQDFAIADMSSLSLSDFADTTAGIPCESLHQAPSVHFQPYQYVSPAPTYQATIAHPAPTNVESPLPLDHFQLSQMDQHKSPQPQETNFISTSFGEAVASTQPLTDFFYGDPENFHRMSKLYGPY